MRIPAVLDGDRPVGLLPLVLLSSGRWEFAGRGGGRMRYRPVLGAEQADEEVLGLLAEQVGRAGVRDLTLPRMPGRDPATDALAAALGQAGFRVARRERSSDCLALVEGGWDEHRRRFAGYEKSVRRFANRMKPLWDVTLDERGPAEVAGLEEGYRLFAGVHAHSWKKPLTPAMRTQALELLRRSGPRGWPRVYVLRVAGVPAAVHIWFRLGPVATWLETAYDQRLSALGPGTILMWWSQERIFRESAPRGGRLHPRPQPAEGPARPRPHPDRGPGGGPAHARLGRDLPGPPPGPLRRPRGGPAGAAQAGRPAPEGWNPGGALAGTPPGPGGRPRPRRRGRARRRRAAVAELELDASARRFLAAVTGHHSPDAMAGGWAEGTPGGGSATGRWPWPGSAPPTATARPGRPASWCCSRPPTDRSGRS